MTQPTKCTCRSLHLGMKTLDTKTIDYKCPVHGDGTGYKPPPMTQPTPHPLAVKLAEEVRNYYLPLAEGLKHNDDTIRDLATIIESTIPPGEVVEVLRSLEKVVNMKEAYVPDAHFHDAYVRLPALLARLEKP